MGGVLIIPSTLCCTKPILMPGSAHIWEVLCKSNSRCVQIQKHTLGEQKELEKKEKKQEGKMYGSHGLDRF